MHPPFFFVDHKIGPDIHHQTATRPTLRRALPARLDLQPASAGWPPVPLALPDGFGGNLPANTHVPHYPALWVVPQPKRTWRDVLGRLLIRAGQRMIMENRA